MAKSKNNKNPAAKTTSQNNSTKTWVKVIAIVLAALMVLSVVFIAVSSL